MFVWVVGTQRGAMSVRGGGARRRDGVSLSLGVALLVGSFAVAQPASATGKTDPQASGAPPAGWSAYSLAVGAAHMVSSTLSAGSPHAWRYRLSALS